VIDQKNNAPRRYFVDGHGHRVLIGLSLEETTEFETLDGLPVPGEGGGAVETSGDGAPSPIREARWRELYAKHDHAWKAWIARSRAEQAASLGFLNYS
jgi:hypothetical protein